MSKDPHHPGSCILLSPTILDQLKLMPGGALKVYIHLCACYEGQPFSATIPQLAAATGLKRRSVIGSVKVLRERKLVTRFSGSGNQPNQYSIHFPKRQDTAAPPPVDATFPYPGLRQSTPSAATLTGPMMQERTIAPGSTKSDQGIPPAVTPTPTTAPELIAALPAMESGPVSPPRKAGAVSGRECGSGFQLLRPIIVAVPLADHKLIQLVSWICLKNLGIRLKLSAIVACIGQAAITLSQCSANSFQCCPLGVAIGA